VQRLISRALKPCVVAALSLWYKGNRYSCPLCGGHFRRLRPYTATYFLRGERLDHFTPNAICPRCGSGIRQRLLFAVLEQKLDLSRPRTVLHFAPEENGAEFFRGQRGLYIAADIEPQRPSYASALQADIQNVPLRADSVDVVVCSHVLEHVVEDEQAITELCRVVKPGGCAVIAVPIYGDHTYEDRTLDAAGRERMYGIGVHVRLNGLDIRDKLRRAGFAVDTVTLTDVPSQYFDRSVKSPHVESDRFVFFCTKS
jgi:SAM-dependent methyltransferase